VWGQGGPTRACLSAWATSDGSSQPAPTQAGAGSPFMSSCRPDRGAPIRRHADNHGRPWTVPAPDPCCPASGSIAGGFGHHHLPSANPTAGRRPVAAAVIVEHRAHHSPMHLPDPSSCSGSGSGSHVSDSADAHHTCSYTQVVHHEARVPRACPVYYTLAVLVYCRTRGTGQLQFKALRTRGSSN
jgi:hypothetical protein